MTQLSEKELSAIKDLLSGEEHLIKKLAIAPALFFVMFSQRSSPAPS
mgnify:CR=1 FL=1